MHLKLIIFLLIVFSPQRIAAQEKKLKHSHSHNDYKQKHRLNDALKNNFSSIEVDIFLVKEELIVSHLHPIIRKQSLELLYLKPLKELCEKQNGKVYADAPLILLIDIKSNAEKTYIALKDLLQKYSSLLTYFKDGKVIPGAITIILSGNKPHLMLQKETFRFAFIDQSLSSLDQSLLNSTYPMASAKYSDIIKWNGKGIIPIKEKEQLTALTKLAHDQGKIVRLWASPENQIVWKELLNCGVDLINTNELNKLKAFLDLQEKEKTK